MRIFLIFTILVTSFLFASDVDIEKEKRTKQAIEKAIAKEKLYAKEKMFYDYDSYDFDHAEVNEESLPTVKEQEVDDLDMDDVYD